MILDLIKTYRLLIIILFIALEYFPRSDSTYFIYYKNSLNQQNCNRFGWKN